MKKIAFIDTCFTGSILPLVKRYIDDGWKVDLYELCANRINKKLEAMTFEEIPCPHGVGDIPEKYWKHIYPYISPENFRFRYISTIRPYKTVPVLRNVVNVYRRLQLNNAADIINSEGYDVVNIVALYWHVDFIPLIRRIQSKIIFSVHEVCNHFSPDFSKLPPLLEEVFKRNIPVVVFSDNSYNDLAKYEGADMANVHVIPFGRFESYKYMVRKGLIDTGKDYFLFIGVLKPYKGLDLFAKAIEMLEETHPKLRYVVAGAGNDEYLPSLYAKKNVTVINRFIDNDEFANLLNDAYAVVCPYKTASQSGIPQTSYVFGKPVVATNIGSFHSILGEGRLGLLTQPESVESLADAMQRLWEDKELYNSLVDNISHFDEIVPEFSWNRIYNMYKTIIEQ